MEFVLESLKCEVIVGCVALSLIPLVWVDLCLSKCLPLLCEVNIVLACALPLSVEFVLLERGVVYSRLYCPKSSVEVSCVGVLYGQVSGNPSV